MDRGWFRTAVAAETAAEQLRAHVDGTQSVLARVAPITKVLESAATTDPAIAELWPDQAEDPRLTVQTAAATHLLAKPGARSDVTVEHAADILYAVLSPEVYLLLVTNRGWTSTRWKTWAYNTLHHQLVD